VCERLGSSVPTTHLDYDANDDVWQKTFTVPAGSWEYKEALNDSSTENYGLNAQPGGANILLPLASSTGVKFYYPSTGTARPRGSGRCARRHSPSSAHLT
jgi:pullulanase-like protein